jgi:hypothetical protein
MRFTVTPGAEGVVRIPRDIHVQMNAGGELVVVSPSPGMPGEHLTLEIFEAGSSSIVRVQVAESRPVVVDGLVRHRLRLRIGASSDGVDKTPPAMDRDANDQ